MVTPTEAPGWQGILDEGEAILWQGRPSSRVNWLGGDLRSAMLGLFMIAFALFWMYQAARSGTMMWVFGSLFLVVGLRTALSENLLPAYIRSRSWYTLTDRRAIVATDMPIRGRRLFFYPITPATPVTLVPGDPGSIYFAPVAKAETRAEGFLQIPDAEGVMRIIRKIQTGEMTKDAP